MLKKYVFTGSVAAVCAAVAAGAQTPAGSTAQQDPAQPATAHAQAGTEHQEQATLKGCVYREADVPGRSPNVAEQVGIGEDYILAETEAAGEQASAVVQQDAMFKLEHADDERLRATVGKRVEVSGRIDAEADDSLTTGSEAARQPDQSVGPDSVELPEFEVTSIREVEGTCPPAPGADRSPGDNQ